MFLINACIIFDSEKRQLSDRRQVVELNENMSRCLLVLALNAGHIITKETLISQVWEQQGVVVSETSVRQTLSQLRKAFAAFGLHQGVILTVPRKGYKLLHAELIRVVAQDLPTPNIPSVTQPVPIEPPVKPDNFWRRPRYYAMLLLLVLFTAGITAWVQYRIYVKPINYVAVTGQTDVYVQEELVGQTGFINGALARFHHYVSKGFIKITNKPRLYINRTIQSGNTSFFICPPREPESFKECQSLVIIGEAAP